MADKQLTVDLEAGLTASATPHPAGYVPIVCVGFSRKQSKILRETLGFGDEAHAMLKNLIVNVLRDTAHRAYADKFKLFDRR